MNQQEEQDLKEGLRASVDLQKQKASVPIVAIGSSVGGLHPLEQFFESLIIEHFYAFVVIQHLSPEFRGVIDALLLSRSKMTVEPIVDGIKLKPNTIYLNNPNTQVIVDEDRLRVIPVSPTEENYQPIDQFFKSLSENRGSGAIGIVLSGIGSDGTYGSLSISEAGGSVFVQDPLTTRFAEMPESVINSVDKAVIASPRQLAKNISVLRFQHSVSISSKIEDQASINSTEITTHNLHGEIMEIESKNTIGTDFNRVQSDAMQRVIQRGNTIGFLISKDGELVHILGNADEFLPLNLGEYSHQLVDLVVPELKTFVKNLLYKGMGDGFSELTQTVSVNFNELGVENYEVSLENIDATEQSSKYQILCFKKLPSLVDETEQSKFPTNQDQSESLVEPITDASSEVIENSPGVIEKLQRQLNSTKGQLQLALSDLEFSNEGLQSSNHELRSTTEELQRTVQELHSVTEELSTVSTELISKNRELTERSRDVELLLAVSGTGTIHFDKNLKLLRYSENSAQIFNLSPKDLGTTCASHTSTFGGIEIHDTVRSVNESGIAEELSLSIDNRLYSLTILPYTLKSRRQPEGVVIAILDTTDLNSAHNELASLNEQFRVVMDSAPNIIARWNAHTNAITQSNLAFAGLWDCEPRQMIGKNIFDLISESEREDFEDYLFRFSVGDISHQVIEFLLADNGLMSPMPVIIQSLSVHEETISEFQLVGIQP